MNIHPRQILWPTDLSEHSLKGAQYAMAFCKAFKARLHVLHVAPLLVWSDGSVPIMTGGDMLVTTTDTVTPAKQALKTMLLKKLGNIDKIKCQVIAGNAWRDICNYAKNNQIDLIIMTTHGLTGFKHVLIGSTAERVVQHASCPVLTVKSFERDFVDRPSAQRLAIQIKAGLSNKSARHLAAAAR